MRERRVAELVDGGARRGFGAFRVAHGIAAAVEEHDARHLVGNEARRLEHDAAAHAVADEHRARELEVVDERRHVAAVVLDRALRRPPGRAAVPAQVAGDDLVRALEMRELRVPILVRASEAVHEDERRRAAPRAHEMHLLRLGLRLVGGGELLL